MTERIIDQEIRLIPYYRNDEVSFPWYLDPEICRQVDNIDHLYDLERLHNMYDFLNTHGNCYYIEYRGALVGDVSLRDTGEISIVICREYQNKKIGSRCISEMLSLAKEKGLSCVRANIYAFNHQSRHTFLAAGFRQVSDEWYEYELGESRERPSLPRLAGILG